MQNDVFTKVFDSSQDAQEFENKVKTDSRYLWTKQVVAPLVNANCNTPGKIVVIYVGPEAILNNE